MKDIRRDFGLLVKEDRQKGIDEIIAYFESERNEKIGVIAAEEILNFFLQNIGTAVYNKSLEDIQANLKQGMEDLNFKLSELRR